MQRCNHCRAANPQQEDFFPKLIQKPCEFEDAIIHVPQQLNEFGCPDPCLAMRPLLSHVIRHVQHDVGRFQNGISFQYGFRAIWLNECEIQQVDGNPVMQNVVHVSQDAVTPHHINDVMREKTDADVHCVLHLVSLRVMQQPNQRVQQMIQVFADRRRRCMF